MSLSAESIDKKDLKECFLKVQTKETEKIMIGKNLKYPPEHLIQFWIHTGDIILIACLYCNIN